MHRLVSSDNTGAREAELYKFFDGEVDDKGDGAGFMVIFRRYAMQWDFPFGTIPFGGLLWMCSAFRAGAVQKPRL